MADISKLNGYNLKDAEARRAIADGKLTDTTYTISMSGNTITLTGSDGSASSITFTDADTTEY